MAAEEKKKVLPNPVVVEVQWARLTEALQSKPSALRSIIAGSTAGAVEIAITYPAECMPELCTFSLAQMLTRVSQSLRQEHSSIVGYRTGRSSPGRRSAASGTPGVPL